MRILFSVPRYHPNHDGMVAGLLGAGHSVEFLVRQIHPGETHRPEVAVTRLAGSVPARFRQALRRLRDSRPDLVVARNANVFHQLLYVACRMRGIRFLLYVQSPTGYETLKPLRWLSLQIGLWPAHTVNSACPGPPAPVRGKTFDFLPFAMVPGPARTRHVAAGAASGPLRALAIGKLDQPRKNLEPLVRHLAPLLRDGDLRLTIAGLRGDAPSPAYAALQTAIAEEGVAEAVRLVENLDHAAALRLYPEHDVFVLASSRERAAISPLEAMAAGLPVVCSSDNGTNYAVLPGETGVIFPDGDFAAMRAAVQDFVRHREKVERMGRAARRHMLEDFAPAGYARRFAEIVARRFGATPRR